MNQSNSPREIILPAAAIAQVRHIDGRDQIVLTAPDGTDYVLAFEDSHPGDACVTLTSLIGAAKTAEGRYFDRELALDYGAVTR